jgi:hypothetical protein
VFNIPLTAGGEQFLDTGIKFLLQNIILLLLLIERYSLHLSILLACLGVQVLHVADLKGELG